MKEERLKLYIDNPYTGKKYYLYFYDLQPEIINTKLRQLKNSHIKIITACYEILDKKTGSIIESYKLTVKLLNKIINLNYNERWKPIKC